jgi:hypothetical protein
MLLRLGAQKLIVVAMGMMGLVALSTVNPQLDANAADNVTVVIPEGRIRGVAYSTTAPAAVVETAATPKVAQVADVAIPRSEDVATPIRVAVTPTATVPAPAASSVAAAVASTADVTEAAVVSPTEPVVAQLVTTVGKTGVDVAVDPFALGDALSQFTTGKPAYAIDPELAMRFKGIEILAEMNIPLPTLKFEYDGSDEAQKLRMDANIKKFGEEESLPADVAKFKAQLKERELKSKATRAEHNRKRTIVRLMQEAKLTKDATARDQRMKMLEMKFESSKQEEADRRLQLDDTKKEQQKEREARDKANEAARQENDAKNEMLRKLRLEEATKQLKENEVRREEEKQDKNKEIAVREARLAKESESKRKLIESMQAEVEAQMEADVRISNHTRLPPLPHIACCNAGSDTTGVCKL